MEHAELLKLALGQGGSIVILIGVVWFAYRLFIHYVLPAHNQTIERITASHAEDRKAFRSAMENCSLVLHKIDSSTSEIKTDVDVMKSKLIKLSTKIDSITNS
jgi:hypothetical protein